MWVVHRLWWYLLHRPVRSLVVSPSPFRRSQPGSDASELVHREGGTAPRWTLPSVTWRSQLTAAGWPAQLRRMLLGRVRACGVNPTTCGSGLASS
jgi:hypothetical protein